MNHCLRHYDEAIAGVCRACDQPFCERCLVYAFGPRKPPFCLGCALYASGIRNGTRRPPPPPTEEFGEQPDAAGSVATDKRTERSRRRAERDATKAAEKAARKAARSKSGPPPAQAPPVGVSPGGRVPAPSVLQAAAGTRSATTNPFS